MKNCLSLIICLLLTVSLMAGITVESKATYESPRVVQGTPVAGLIPRTEGAANLSGSITFYSNTFDEEDVVTYKWEYNIPQGYEEGAAAFDYSRFLLNYSDFGRTDGAQRTLYLDKKDDWPVNLKERLKYKFTGNKVTFSYTLLAEDIKWMNEHYDSNDKENPLAVRPAIASKKLADNVEAQYCKNNYIFSVTKNEAGEIVNKTATFNFCIDKRTVEIAEAVAPVASDGTVGTYNSKPSKTTYLDDNQEVMVKLTLSRPVGIDKSGDNEVNIKVPAGMTYVTGSMSATYSSGLTVNLTDSATSPKFTFTGLPVGENIVVTYKLKAGSGDTPVKYNTSNTLTNLKQKGLTASANNDYMTGSVYSEDEYNTTTTMPLQLDGKYKITFDSKGGNYTPDDQIIKGGDLSTKPANPTKEDNKYGKVVFQYWYYIDEKGKEVVFDFSTPIRANYVLYAKYKEPNPSVNDTDGTGVDTGDNNITGYIALGLISLVTLLALTLLSIRRKKELE